MLKPHILRRVKEDVMKEVPDKVCYASLAIAESQYFYSHHLSLDRTCRAYLRVEAPARNVSRHHLAGLHQASRDLQNPCPSEQYALWYENFVRLELSAVTHTIFYIVLRKVVDHPYLLEDVEQRTPDKQEELKRMIEASGANSPLP